MKFNEFEKRLRTHADSIKDTMATPFDIEREELIMKKKSVNVKKTVIFVAAVVCIIGTTVFAANSIIKSWYSSSSSVPEYTQLPTPQQCIEDIGYEPVLIESFDNGYEFKNGSVVNNSLRDEEDNTVEKFKSVFFRYEKDGDVLNFTQEKFNSELDMEGDIAARVDDVDIYYFSYTNKFVPPDYKMTDEDKQAEESGELIFSYGSSNVEIKKVQSVSWTDNGIRFSLMQIDGRLTESELVQMAEEIISE
ncbi:MAG: hypothetical protein IJ366_06195 [Clostridia bacterium]|nr:hypothetical protein [Clostridia bacterium]